MRKQRLVTYFSKYNDADLVQKAKLIFDSMSGNTNFLDPTPDLNELKVAIDAFQEAIIQAEEGGKLEIRVRNNKRKQLIEILNGLARYVRFKADRNIEKLTSSGFSLSKPEEPVGILPKPENFSIHPDDSGMVKLKLKAIRGAKSYRYEYKKSGEQNWEVVVHTQSNILITNLESGQKYDFRVAGVGTEKERRYSEVVSSFVL